MAALLRHKVRHGLAAGVAAVALVSATFAPAGAVAAEIKGDPIAIGFNAPLSGPVAGWGLPGLTGIKIWMDEINAEGGLLVGDERRPLELYLFDNEYVPSKALQGARELVLEHDVKFITGVGGSTGDTQIPFLTENNVVYAPLYTTDIRPDRPFVIAGMDVFPRGEMMRARYLKETYPDLKAYAIISPEDTGSHVCQAWERGAAEAAGWEIVYDEHYAPDTTDFAAVVTAMLATNPDAVSLCNSWPEFIPLIMKQLYQQGFEGPVAMNYIEWEAVLQHVPVEWAEKVDGFDSYPRMDDPWWGEPSAQSTFTAEWTKRFGKGAPEDVGQPMTGIDWLYLPTLQAWAYGIEKAGTVEASAVIEAMRSSGAIPTIMGPAEISGKDMFGANNMISAPVPTTQFDPRCKCKRIVEMRRFEPWFTAHTDTIVAVVRDRGLMWDQRK